MTNQTQNAAVTALKWLGLALTGFAYLAALVFLLAVAADYVGALS